MYFFVALSSKSSSLIFLCKLIETMFHLFSVICYVELTAGLTSFQSSQDCRTSLQRFSVFSF